MAVKATATLATVAGYGYDALGDRITEAYSGTTGHLYDAPGGGVIEERVGGTAPSNLATQYVWGVAGNLVLRDSYSGGTLSQRLYALRDANGDTTALVSTGGAVLERYAYSPYGAVTVLDASGTPVSGNSSAYGWRYLFQGGRLDTTSGLYRFGARDYNPAEGHWSERDPIGLTAGDENLYRFVGNHPVLSSDPAGLAEDQYWGGNWNPVNWIYWGLGGGLDSASKIANTAQNTVSDIDANAAYARSRSLDPFDIGSFNPGGGNALNGGGMYPGGRLASKETTDSGEAAVSTYAEFASAGGPAGFGGMKAAAGKTCPPIKAPNKGPIQNIVRVHEAGDAVGRFLGDGFVIKRNDAKGFVAMSQDGKRIFRMDIQGHRDSPHTHIEIFDEARRRFVDAGPVHRYYFNGE